MRNADPASCMEMTAGFAKHGSIVFLTACYTAKMVKLL